MNLQRPKTPYRLYEIRKNNFYDSNNELLSFKNLKCLKKSWFFFLMRVKKNQTRILKYY